MTWGKVIIWITTDGFNEWKVEYYDEEMELVNVMNAYNIKQMGDREVPTKMEIEPANKKGNKTILEMVNIVYNQPIPDNLFSQQNMKSVK